MNAFKRYGPETVHTYVQTYVCTDMGDAICPPLKMAGA